MKRLLTFILGVGIISSAYPQTACTRQSSDFMDFYRKQDSYIPYANSPHAGNEMKKVKIRIIVLQRFGYPNFVPADSGKIREIVDYMNGNNKRLSGLDAPSKPATAVCGSCHISDSKFRVELAGIDFVQTTDNNVSPHFKHEDEELNIFFINDGNGTAGGNTGYRETGSAAYAADEIMNGSNSYTPYIEAANYYTSNYNAPWGSADNLIHELSHALGLMHHYSYTGWVETCNPNDLDYLNDVFYGSSCPRTVTGWGCDPYDPNSPCDNNYMGGGTAGGYFSPQQLGRMHRDAHFLSVRKYIYPVDAPDVTPWVITKNETWDFDIKLYSNIIVRAGNKLTIKCKVQLPNQGSIIVEPGAIVEIDGGTITSDNKHNMWEGIIVLGNKYRSQNYDPTAPFNSCWQGKLILKNGAVLENGRRMVMLWGADGSANAEGGIVIATDATFRNMFKGAEFMSYHNYDPNNNNGRPNLSRFTNCTFEWTQAANQPVPSANGITMWDVEGVKIEGCRFVNHVAEKNLYPKTYGISQIDAGMTVDKYCPSLMCYDPVPNTFEKLDRGISYGHLSGGKKVIVRNSKFINNVVGIEGNSDVGAEITGNEFQVGSPYQNSIESYGIWLEESDAYRLNTNRFHQSTNGEGYGINRIGVFAKNTGSENNFIRNNSYNSLYIGNLSNGYNGSGFAQYSTGLQYICNGYQGLDYDEAIQSNDDYNEGIRRYQGNPGSGAGNTFSTYSYTGAGPVNVYYSQSGSPATITYFYGSGANEMPANITGSVSLVPTNNVTNCSLPSVDDPAINPGPIDHNGFGLMLGNILGADDEVKYANLEQFLVNNPSPHADLYRTYFYIETGRYAEAIALYTGIVSHYEMNPVDAHEFEAGKPLIDLMIAYRSNNLPMNVITDEDLDVLNHVYQDGTSWAKIRAGNWRLLARDIPFEHIAQLPGSMSLYKHEANEGLKNAGVGVLPEIYPNPSDGVIWISNKSNQKMTIEFREMATGRLLETVEVASRSKLKVNTAKWTSGIVSYKVINQESSATGKLVIIK